MYNYTQVFNFIGSFAVQLVIPVLSSYLLDVDYFSKLMYPFQKLTNISLYNMNITVNQIFHAQNYLQQIIELRNEIMTKIVESLKHIYFS